MNFAQSVKQNTRTAPAMKRTENGAVAFSTTSNDLLDMFATIGALRPRSEAEIEQKFAKAFAVDPLLATKMMFYSGNIRGGLGERRTFRVCLKWLVRYYPEIVVKNIELIPEFNRWDSVFSLVGTNFTAEKAMWELVSKTLQEDMILATQGKPCSLLAKWMPSENASSKETKKLARKAMEALHVDARTYRKILSRLRKHIDVTEVKMSAQMWEHIKYKNVPSYAMKNYNKAFRKHDSERFNDYLESVKRGEAKINATTLYPYDLVHKVWGRSDEVSDLQWNALPNYVSGENNFIVMADVSGSMIGRPIETSIGLAAYFAQHNKGDYHNLYMTFTNSPHFIEIREGASISEIVRQVLNKDVGYSTNLMAAFDEILNHAVRNNIHPDDMPKALIVVSDMEIDKYFRPYYHWDFLQTVRAKFAERGYPTPKLVLWNVEARNDTFLSNSADVLLVSGQSASTFKQLCTNLEGKTAWDLMLETLNDEVYDCVRI